MPVGPGEILNADLCQREFVPARSEGMPAKFAIPVPMEIRAIIIFEGHAAPSWTIAAARNLWIVQHIPSRRFPVVPGSWPMLWQSGSGDDVSARNASPGIRFHQISLTAINRI